MQLRFPRIIISFELQELNKMTRKIIGSIQLNPGTEPVSPVEGQMYYDSTDKKVKTYNGSEWI